MDLKFRVVTQLPLQELWRASGFVQFVVVDAGAAPQWIPASECFNFWKTEVKPHLASEDRISLQDFPGEYCYFASKWDSVEPSAPIIVLEKQH